MGTTITTVLIWDSYYILAHVGDSRAYLMRNNKLEQLTNDHSFVGQMIRDGQLPYEAYYEHPRRNVITRALGQFEEIQIDLWTNTLAEGDRFLLCSDGLWEMVRDPELEAALKQESTLAEIAEAMVDMANQNGGSDNISVVLGEVKKT